MRHGNVSNTFQQPTVTSIIDVKKTTAWGESGFPSEFLGLPISFGKGLRPVKRPLGKSFRIRICMTLPIPGFKARILSEVADSPQVEFQGPLFQLGHTHPL